LATFSSTYPNWSSALNMGSMASNAVRYVQVSVQLDSAAGNSMQGRAANIGVSWRLEQ
jgi:hypothetical protein